MTAQYNQARQIFFQTNYNNVKIAEATGVSRKTIGLWMKEGKWKQLKRGTEIMPIALAQNIQLQLLELQKSIQNRPEGNRFPTMQEAEIQRKLIVSYTKIGATPFSVDVQVMTDFTEMLTVTNKDLLYQIASECDKFIDYKCDRLTNIQNEYQEIYEHFSQQSHQNQTDTEEDYTPPPPEEDFTYFPDEDDDKQNPFQPGYQSVTQKGSPIIHNPTDNQSITPHPLPKTNNSDSVTSYNTDANQSQYDVKNPHTIPSNSSVTQKGSAIIHKATDNQPTTSQNQPKTNNSGSVTLPNNSGTNAKPTTNPTPNNENPNIKRLGVNPHRIGTKAWQDFNNLKARIFS